MAKKTTSSSKPAANHPWRSGLKKKPMGKGGKSGKAGC
jgi:hypothetical protein